MQSLRHLPLSFESNVGQTGANVRFLSRGPGYTIFLTPDEAVFSLQSSNSGKSPSPKSQPTDPALAARPKSLSYSVVRMSLSGASPQATVHGLDELPGKTNYFRGNDSSKWHTNVSNYARVRYEDVYPGIDLIYYGNQGQLESDFLLAPGADPNAIAMSFSGARSIRIDATSGDLVVKSGGGEIRLHKPVAYQGNSLTDPHATQVAASYLVHAHNRVTFRLGACDHTRPLVIDPAVSYSTYLGGSAGDYATSIAVDSSGNTYVAGYTGSTNFPVTSGAYQTKCSGACDGTLDAFVTKLDSSGSALIYSTYLGGTANDYANGIAMDDSGNAYIVGQTFSSNFPVTTGAYQTACGGGSCSGGDAFITELNSSGSALIYSTYLGGSSKNQGNAIVLDSANNAYITGWTQSTDFPVSAGAFQTKCTCTNQPDAFVTKLNPHGTALVYSTYLGGKMADVGYAIALSASENVYVAGYTASTNFPVTTGAFQTALNAPTAGFVAEFNTTGTELVYSTYLGGSTTATTNCEACVTGIALDSSGNAVIAGLTAESNFPVTPGAFQTTNNSTSNGHNAFVTELNPTGSAAIFSTYLGGSGDTGANAVAVEPASGNVWVKGNTKATDFPVTPGCFQPANAGNYDFFLVELNPTGTTELYGTYLGGSGVEYGGATTLMALDTQIPPNVYITGYTASTNFPVTSGAFQTNNAGANDAVITKFTPSPNVGLAPTSLNFGSQIVGTTSASQTVTLTNTGNTNLNAPTITVIGTNSADFKQTNTCSGSIVPQAACTISLTFTPSLFAAESATLNIADNAPTSPQAVPLSGTGIANGPAVTLTPSSLTFPVTLLNVKSASQTITLSNPGTATLDLTSIVPSGDFSETSTCKSTVAVGGSCTITVYFTPTQINTRTGAVTVTDNAPTSPQTASLTGTGTEVKLSVASINFGSVTVGSSSATRKVTLTNEGTTTMTLSPTTITGTDPSDFSQTNDCGASVNAGANCTFDLTFTPLVKGALSATLTLTDTGGGSPQTVTLIGTGK